MFSLIMDWKKHINHQPKQAQRLPGPFLLDCCKGTRATPEQVLDKLLSPDDIEMIALGEHSSEQVHAHIEAWVKAGKPIINR